jgi:hypothetical protein
VVSFAAVLVCAPLFVWAEDGVVSGAADLTRGVEQRGADVAELSREINDSCDRIESAATFDSYLKQRVALLDVLDRQAKVVDEQAKRALAEAARKMRQDLERIVDADADLRRVKTLAAVADKFAEKHGRVKAAMQESIAAARTVDTLSGNLAKLKDTQTRLRAEVERLTRVAAAQKDPATKDFNVRLLARARGALADLDRQIADLTSRRTVAEGMLARLSADTHQLVAQIKALREQWNRDTRQLEDARARARQMVAAPGSPALTAFRGQVEVRHASGEKMAGTLNRPLQPGDQIVVGRGGHATCTFADGSRIVIGPNAHFVVGEGGDRDLKAGAMRIWNRLKHGRYTNLRTPTAVTSVRGTDALFIAEGGTLRVLLREGAIELNQPTEQKLSAGRQLVVHASGEIEEEPLDEQLWQRAVMEMAGDL